MEPERLGDTEEFHAWRKTGIPDRGGLYRLYWVSGGTSVAAVGTTANGDRWYMPTNWINGPATDWSLVQGFTEIDDGAPARYDGREWVRRQLDEAITEGRPVPGEMDDYLELQAGNDPIACFNVFIRRWVDPAWWPHLMDSDDNEAEYVRRAIERAKKKGHERG